MGLKRLFKARRYGRRHGRASTAFRKWGLRRFSRPSSSHRRGMYRRGGRSIVRTSYKRTSAPVDKQLFIKYGSRRRYPRSSRRFEKKVADIISKPIRIIAEQITNISAVTDVNAKYWSNIGTYGDYSSLFAKLFANADDFNTQDIHNGIPAATIYNVSATVLRLHLLEYKRTLSFTNTSTTPVNMTSYSFTPRYAISSIPAAGSPSSLRPDDIINNETTSGTLLATTTSIAASDPRYTPYMCPTFLQFYKILGVKKSIINPGGTVHITQVLRDVTVSNIVAGPPGQYYLLPGKSKSLMVKFYGIEGTRTDDTSKSLLSAPYLRCRQYDVITVRKGHDIREIAYEYPNVPTLTTNNNVTFINELQGTKVAAQSVNP